MYSLYCSFSFSAIQEILARLDKTQALNKSATDEDSDFDLFGTDGEEPSRVKVDPPKDAGKKRST